MKTIDRIRHYMKEIVKIPKRVRESMSQEEMQATVDNLETECKVKMAKKKEPKEEPKKKKGK